MPERPITPEVAQITTAGDYSPGIVMGNYTVNESLAPAALSLEDAFKVRLEFRPSDHGYFADTEHGQKLFVNGCKFAFHIGNAGSSDLILRYFRLSVVVQDFDAARMPKKEKGYGRMFIPHQLYIDLYRDAAPGWWLLSDGVKHAEPRRFDDAREDMLASPSGPRLQFRLSAGELEAVEGAITPREPGLFRVRFLFGLVTASEALSRASSELLILKGETDGN